MAKIDIQPRYSKPRLIVSSKRFSCVMSRSVSLETRKNYADQIVQTKLPGGGGGVLDISLGGEVRYGPSYPDPV